MEKVIVLYEYEEVTLPRSIWMDAGKIDAFESALDKNYFSIRLKRGEFILQAGGYIGVVHINNELSIDIRPKIPVVNLERLLFITRGDAKVYPKGYRKYGASRYLPDSIEDFLYMEVLSELEKLHNLGLIKRYEEVNAISSSPRGKVDVFGTVLSSRVSGSAIAKYSFFERAINTPENQFVKALVVHLHEKLKHSKDKDIKRRISYCLSFFDSVELCSFPDVEKIVHSHLVPMSKVHYRRIIELGKLIFNSHGLTLINDGGEIESSSILISLEDVFERYVLWVLEKLAVNFGGIKVKDGNRGGESGGRKPLLSKTEHSSQIKEEIVATPDILVESKCSEHKVENIVIDVKYKVVSSIPSRADINQVISYASSYKSKHAILVLPAVSNKKGLECLGSFNGVGLFQYFIDLSNTDYDREEKIFSDAMFTLFDVSF